MNFKVVSKLSKKEEKYIEPVEKLPKLRKKTRKGEKYDKILQQFKAGNMRYARIKPEVGRSAAVFSALTKRIRRQKLPIRIRVRTDPETKKMSLYLERTDL